MSIVYLPQPRRAGRIDRMWQREYTVTYKVVTSDKAFGPLAVRQACPVRLGDYYAETDGSTVIARDLGVFCSEITATEADPDGLGWEVVCTFTQYNPTLFSQNPLDHPIRISWGFAKFEMSIHEDINGDAIRNSAKDFFDPAITVDDSRPLLRITRNEAVFDPVRAFDFKDGINSDPFWGGDPYTWKCADITADLEFNVDSGTSDGWYWVVTYEFEYNPDTWKARALDQGRRSLNSSGAKVNITDANGVQITDPENLDGHGAKLAIGSDPVFFDFHVYRELEFAELEIDPTGAPGQGA